MKIMECSSIGELLIDLRAMSEQPGKASEDGSITYWLNRVNTDMIRLSTPYDPATFIAWLTEYVNTKINELDQAQASRRVPNEGDPVFRNHLHWLRQQLELSD